jgi:tetratricopeptide (TPR) repeat protein
LILYQGALEYAIKRKFETKANLKILLDDEELDEESRGVLSQIFFFLGITYRALQNQEEAIQSYQNAIQLNHFFSDCYFNLGNIYYEQSDFTKADLCYKSSLEALEEDRKIQMYRHLDDDYQ